MTRLCRGLPGSWKPDYSVEGRLIINMVRWEFGWCGVGAWFASAWFACVVWMAWAVGGLLQDGD
jgi:hypothetical protein